MTRTSGSPGAGEPGGRAGAPTASVSILLNGEPRSVEAGLSVEGLLRRLGLDPRMVVVERNREILSRGAVGATPVEEGDGLELVHFVGGG